MQDFQSAPAGLAGRIFFGGGGGGGGGGDGGDAGDFRRFRGYPTVGGGPPAAAQQQLPVKCPRCDSANTKFCYYNNYNLSQPRHFCKSCRRYWTKGGVLRNVPVGGGCRKAKRSSSSSSKSSSKSSASGEKEGQQRRMSSSSVSRLSSESSGITTAGPGDASALALPFSDGNVSNSNNPTSISGDPPFHQLVDTPPCSAPETLPEPQPSGSFANFIVPSAATPSASPVPFLGFGFSDLSPVRLPTGQHKTVEEMRVQEQEQEQEQEQLQLQQQQQQQEGFIIDHTIAGDLRPVAGVGGGAGGLGALDWPTSVDPALFDLTSAVDPGAYWNQSHWGDTDASLYLP